MVLYWLLHNGNCRGPKNSCRERQQLTRSSNEPNADHHHREKHTMSLMKSMIISVPGQVTALASSPPQLEATFPSRSHSDILAHSILFLAFECLIASSPRLTLSTAVPTVFTIRLGILAPPSGKLATQIPAHRRGRTDQGRTTMLLPHSLFLSLSSLATLCAPQKQRDSLQATTRAGTLFRLLPQRSRIQHALYVRLP
jgi:hypothetical protein